MGMLTFILLSSQQELAQRGGVDRSLAFINVLVLMQYITILRRESVLNISFALVVKCFALKRRLWVRSLVWSLLAFFLPLPFFSTCTVLPIKTILC